MPEARHFWVTGRVQGVYFRASTQARAQALGLTGWVRNLADGRVEGLACGDVAALQALMDWLTLGPDTAEVSHLEVRSVEAGDFSRFDIRR